MLSKDEARRIAANVAKPPELLRKPERSAVPLYSSGALIRINCELISRSQYNIFLLASPMAILSNPFAGQFRKDLREV